MGNPEASEAHEEIKQEHINRVEAIARHLATTTALGRLCGEEELISEAMVVLWDLTLAFDPDLGVPFTAYLSTHTRFRLIDYLRSLYGRVITDGVIPPRMEAALATYSLDELRDGDDARSGTIPLVDAGPTVEEIVESRDEVARLGKILRSGELSYHQMRSLMWPVYEGSPQPYMAESGKHKVNVSSTRSQAKEKVSKLLDRPLYVREYRRGFNKNQPQPEDIQCGDDTAKATGTPDVREPVLDRAEARARGLLDLERARRPGRVRQDSHRLQAGAPGDVRGAGGTDSRRMGDRPHLQRAELREPGAPGGGHPRGERPTQDRADDRGTRRDLRERPRPRRDATVAQEQPAAVVVHLLRARAVSTTKGSSGVMETNGRRKHRGSKHTLAKVTDEQLLADRAHMTLQEIGDKYNVSASAVCHRLKKLGETKTRPRYDDLIPWRVAMEHGSAPVLAGLRALGAHRRGKTLSEADQRLLERFLRQMVEENVVVEYSRIEGFTLVKRALTDPDTHPYYEEAVLGPVSTQMSA